MICPDCERTYTDYDSDVSCRACHQCHDCFYAMESCYCEPCDWCGFQDCQCEDDSVGDFESWKE